MGSDGWVDAGDVGDGLVGVCATDSSQFRLTCRHPNPPHIHTRHRTHSRNLGHIIANLDHPWSKQELRNHLRRTLALSHRKLTAKEVVGVVLPQSQMGEAQRGGTTAVKATIADKATIALDRHLSS